MYNLNFYLVSAYTTPIFVKLRPQLSGNYHPDGLYLIIFLYVFLIAWWELFTKAETCSKQ
jgi:hypothetical protein